MNPNEKTRKAAHIDEWLVESIDCSVPDDLKVGEFYSELLRTGFEAYITGEDSGSLTSEEIVDSVIEAREHRIEQKEEEKEDLRAEIKAIEEEQEEERETIADLKEMKDELDVSAESLDATVDAVVAKVNEERGVKVSSALKEVEDAVSEMDVTEDDVMQALWDDDRLELDDYLETPEDKPSVEDIRDERRREARRKRTMPQSDDKQDDEQGGDADAMVEV